MTKEAKKNQVKKNTYTTVVVNNTIYDLELHEETICESKKLQVLKSKSQVSEGNINDEPTRESNFCEVKIMDNTDETYKVFVRKHQPMRQLSIPRHELINNQQIIIHYDKKQRSLKCDRICRGDQSFNKNLDIHGTTDSKRPCGKEQTANDPNGEHPAKRAAKDVIRSPRKTQRQLFPDPENSQDMILHSEPGCQECIESPREDQKTRKRKNSSNTFDLHGTTDSKGACETECKPNDPDGEHPTKRTKANHCNHDVEQSPYKT
ncbi:unnamed protein product [Sphagnum compactum]